MDRFSVKEVIRPYVDPSTGKSGEHTRYQAGDQEFVTFEAAFKYGLGHGVAEVLNTAPEVVDKAKEIGKDFHLHVLYNPNETRFELDWNAVLQCSTCDRSWKRLARDIINANSQSQ